MRNNINISTYIPTGIKLQDCGVRTKSYKNIYAFYPCMTCINKTYGASVGQTLLQQLWLHMLFTDDGFRILLLSVQ